MDKTATQLDTAVALMQSLATGGDTMDAAAMRSYLAPFIAAGRCVIGTAKRGESSEHFGFALWAKVSEETSAALAKGEVDPRVTGLAGLEPGTQCWIVDLVCPIAMADPFLSSTTAAMFPGEQVMACLRDKDGNARCIIAQQA